MRLSDPTLLKTQAFINGAWVDGAGTFDVVNPATGDVIANVADCSIEQVREAIDAAYEAQKEWKKLTGKERGAVLRKWHDLMLENADDLGQILTAEMGKPFAEGKGEVVYGASFLEWFAEEAKRVYGDTIPGHQRDKRIVVIKQPVGVVGSITPWNFPNAMIAPIARHEPRQTRVRLHVTQHIIDRIAERIGWSRFSSMICGGTRQLHQITPLPTSGGYGRQAFCP